MQVAELFILFKTIVVLNLKQLFKTIVLLLQYQNENFFFRIGFLQYWRGFLWPWSIIREISDISLGRIFWYSLAEYPYFPPNAKQVVRKKIYTFYHPFFYKKRRVFNFIVIVSREVHE